MRVQKKLFSCRLAPELLKKLRRYASQNHGGNMSRAVQVLLANALKEEPEKPNAQA